MARLAGGQHGVVARHQLVALGLSADAVEHRLRTGRLHRLHQGVYAVGHRAVSREGRWLAAVLASGAGAALSHRSAAALWGLRPTARARIDVTVPGPKRPRPGIEPHRASIADDEITEKAAIPVTTPARTLLDLAPILDRKDLARTLEQAEILRLATAPTLDELFLRYPRRPGAATLKNLNAGGAPGTHPTTRSELEDRFLALLANRGLPAPRVNQRLEAGSRTFEVDCHWPGSRLVVELDGHATHATPTAFERDRERDRLLHAAGWAVVRITWRQLHREPADVAGDLARLLETRER